MTYHSKMLQWDSWRSNFTTTIFTRGVSSVQELPCLGTLQLRLILEGFFIQIASPNNWGKTGVEFLTLTGLKRSEESINLVILITNRVGERDFDMVTVFCHPNQAKIEACHALSILCQCDSSEPSVVLVRRYSNTPYIPRGMSHSLYQDVGTLSGGASSAKFPLCRLHLHQLIPFTRTEALLPCEEGEERLDTYPHLPEILWVSSEEDHNLSNPISLSVPI